MCECRCSPGALGLKDCVSQPSITMTFKGPSDVGHTSEPVTAHGTGLPLHKPFDQNRFRQIVSIISDIKLDRIAIGSVRDVWNFSRSRCAQMRGGCMFDVSINLQAENGPQLLTAIERLSGDECHASAPTDDCPSPDVNKTAIYGRSLLFQEFEILQIKEVRMQGRDSGECPDRFIASTEAVTRFIDMFKGSGKGGAAFSDAETVGLYRCPSKFYRVASGYCLPCPDMTTSDKGATSAAHCAPFNTIILVAKDASLTYEARTNEAVNGYASAQPNALTLNDGAKAYLKIRGYALHPNDPVDANDANAGLQIDMCQEGLNCFNESRFQEDVSALFAAAAVTVTPNQVRLIKPNTCLFVDKATRFDGLGRHIPPSASIKSLCGPWPGLPPTPGKCVCFREWSDDDYLRQCFHTNGPALVSKYLGESASNPTVIPNVETVGACAKKAGGYNAFLYNPAKMLCSPRAQISSVNLAIDECSSHSRMCRDMLQLFNPLVSANVFQAGMQMYYAVQIGSDPYTPEEYAAKCDVLVEDDSCFNGQKLKQPLDTHYYYVNLHAETKRDVDGAIEALQNTRDRQAGAGRRSAFEAFLGKYSITEIAIASDKTPLPESAGAGREGSLRGTGNLDAAVDILFESGAVCEWQGGRYSPAVCLTLNGSPDPQQAEAICRLDINRLPIAVVPMCGEGATPQCLGLDASPSCAFAKLMVDDQIATFQPLPCDTDTDRVEQPLCTSSIFFFKGTRATTPDNTVCGPGETNELCTTLPATMLVTRIDIALAHATFDWAAGEAARVLLSFEDGSDQSITLEATNEMWSYYIRPAVSSTVTIRALPRSDGFTLQIGEVDLHGQDVSQIFGAESYLNLFQPVAGAAEPFSCPATTFSTSYQSRAGGAKAYSGCSVCPYPMGSDVASTTFANCTCATCGDGRVSWQQQEQCDDGNVAVNDGCGPTCEIETLQLCQGAKSERGVGLPILSYSQPDECFRLGSSWTRYGLAPWSARYGHRSLSLSCTP